MTGCAGFIGSHLTEELLSQEFKVIGVDNLNPYYDPKKKENNLNEIKKHENSKNFTFINGSLNDQNILEKLPRDVKYVFHLAAKAGVRNSIKNPVIYVENNVLVTAKLLERYKNVDKFVFASSSSVYGELEESELPVKETHELMPISPYALSKKQCEELCFLFSKLYGTKMTCLRYFTVYGPRQRPDEAFTKFLYNFSENKPITIYGDGMQTRDFTYVKDIVNGTILAAKYGKGIYNLGGGNRVTVNHVVDTMKKVTGIELKIENIEKQIGDVSHTGADITKARDELGYVPKTTLEEGIKKHFEWVLEQKSD